MGGGIGSVCYMERPADFGSVSQDVQSFYGDLGYGTGNPVVAEYYAYNAVGSVVANTDQQGFVIRENDFDAYGRVVREQDWTSNNFPIEFGGSHNDLLFSTKERDFSTGLDNFGFRYYDSVLGKFITRDPSGYPDGPNNYLYCSNNPINAIDPLGLLTETQVDEKVKKEYKEKYLQKDSPLFRPKYEDYKSKRMDELANDGYTIYSDDFKKILREPPADVVRKVAAIIIIGGNSKDKHDLMRRTSKSSIENLFEMGYDVNIIQVENKHYRNKDSIIPSKPIPSENLAKIIKSALGQVKDVGKVGVFAHMSETLSLTNTDADITDKKYDGTQDPKQLKSYTD